MCDYSSFSSIDKFPFPCRRGAGRCGLPAPGTAREPPARRRPRAAIAASQPITGGHFNNKEPKVNCFSSEWASVLSIYLPRRSGQIFTIKLEAVEHGCCTNIYISADHSLIAALGENNIASSVTPVWRPECGSGPQSRSTACPGRTQGAIS